MTLSTTSVYGVLEFTLLLRYNSARDLSRSQHLVEPLHLLQWAGLRYRRLDVLHLNELFFDSRICQRFPLVFSFFLERGEKEIPFGLFRFFLWITCISAPLIFFSPFIYDLTIQTFKMLFTVKPVMWIRFRPKTLTNKILICFYTFGERRLL